MTNWSLGMMQMNASLVGDLRIAWTTENDTLTMQLDLNEVDMAVAPKAHDYGFTYRFIRYDTSIEREPLVCLTTIFGRAASSPPITITYNLYGPNDIHGIAAPALTETEILSPSPADGLVFDSPPFYPTIAGLYSWRVSFVDDLGQAAASDISGTARVHNAYDIASTFGVVCVSGEIWGLQGYSFVRLNPITKVTRTIATVPVLEGGEQFLYPITDGTSIWCASNIAPLDDHKLLFKMNIETEAVEQFVNPDGVDAIHAIVFGTDGYVWIVGGGSFNHDNGTVHWTICRFTPSDNSWVTYDSITVSYGVVSVVSTADSLWISNSPTSTGNTWISGNSIYRFDKSSGETTITSYFGKMASDSSNVYIALPNNNPAFVTSFVKVNSTTESSIATVSINQDFIVMESIVVGDRLFCLMHRKSDSYGDNGYLAWIKFSDGTSDVKNLNQPYLDSMTRGIGFDGTYLRLSSFNMFGQAAIIRLPII